MLMTKEEDKQKINITDNELDRDIVNLDLPELDMVPPKSIDDLDFYDDEMKDWLKGEGQATNSNAKK